MDCSVAAATGRFWALVVLLMCLKAPTEATGSPNSPSITHMPYGTTLTGTPVELYTLRNRAGMEVRIATYGCIVTSLSAP